MKRLFKDKAVEIKTILNRVFTDTEFICYTFRFKI